MEVRKMFRIKEIMEEKGVTNAELAKALSVTPQYVSAIVNGKKNLSVSKLEVISRFLGVPLIALFQGYIPPDKVTSNTEVICPSCGHILTLVKVK